MKNSREKIAVIVLLVVLCVPLYAWLVHVVNALGSDDLVQSFVLESGRRSTSSNVFEIGDTLTVKAESESSNSFDLSIYEGSSLVYNAHGEFNEGTTALQVALTPPVFNGGGVYRVCLNVYSFNQPLPGVYFSDSAVSFFEVVGVATSLSLEASYESTIGSLYLNAQLADVYGYPVANETVDFKLQSANTGRLTEGWVPLGSVATKASGVARLNVAFGLPDGNYTVKACHEGTGPFGASQNVTDIEIFLNTTLQDSALSPGSQPRFTAPPVVNSIENLVLEVSSYSPYALLSMNAKAQYTIDVALQGPYLIIVFFLDLCVNETRRLLGGSWLLSSDPQPFESTLLWKPDVIGYHRLTAGVANGTIVEVVNAIHGRGFRLTEEADLNIQRCPTNTVLEYPKGLYGNVLPVTVAVSKPRSYEASSGDFYVTTTLAPHFAYNGADFVFDEGVNSTLVHLFVNGTLAFVAQTNASGLVVFPFELGFSSVQYSLTFTVVTDGSLLLEEEVLERIASFTRVDVQDVPNAGGQMNLTYNINGFTGGELYTAGELYIGVENQLEATVSLSDMFLWNVPVSMTRAKFVSWWIWEAPGSCFNLPSGSDYLRVVSCYGSLAVVDINDDNKIDVKDLAIVAKAFGSEPGDDNWNPKADVTGPTQYVMDGKVDMRDVSLVAKFYGVMFDDSYYLPIGAFLAFDSGQTVYVDSRGCAGIPFGATSFTVWKGSEPMGAVVEFFTIAWNLTSETDSFGRVVESWVPSEVGKYLVQVKLPSDLCVTAVSYSGGFSIDAQLNLVGYFDVVKRPLELSVTFEPSQPTVDTWVTMTAELFDAGLGKPAGGHKVWFYVYDLYNATYLYLGYGFSNSSGIAQFSWKPRDFLYMYPYLSSDFVLSARVDEFLYTRSVEKVPVHVDCRYPSHLEFQMGGDVINVTVGSRYELTVKLTRTDNGSPVSGKGIDLYTNDVKTGWAVTNANGIAYWDWIFDEAGVYYYKAVFQTQDLDHQFSNEARLVAVAAVVPVTALFDVQPRDFSPPSQIMLSATIRDAVTGLPMTGTWVNFYQVGSSTQFLGQSLTNASGVALYPYYYSSGPYAFMANASLTQQTISSSGIMLTASWQTNLALSVERDESSYKHVISGNLTWGGSGVVGKQVKILVNDTLKATLPTTEPGGQFSKTLDLEPLNNKPATYRIVASFEGDTAHTATAYGTTPNGTQYAICTTIHYGFKPSSNSTTLTVEPQSTTATTPTKTPEQLEQEAKDSGWLTVWHEFTWWYPWYRLHFVLDTALPPYGTLYIDYGWSILPFGTSFQANNTVLGLILNDVAQEFVEEYLISTVIAVIAKRIAAGLLGKTIGGILAAIGIYTLFSLLEMGVKYATTGNNLKTWLMAFLSSALACFLDLMVDVLDTLQFLTAVGRRVVGAISHTLNSMWARGLNFFDITSVIFTFIDFALMIGYLIMYKVAVG